MQQSAAVGVERFLIWFWKEWMHVLFRKPLAAHVPVDHCGVAPPGLAPGGGRSGWMSVPVLLEKSRNWPEQMPPPLMACLCV